jgi:membrane protease YdiL (CAAX protease family)
MGADVLPAPSVPRQPEVARYAVGVLVLVVAVVSQYVLPEAWPASRAVYGNLPGDIAVVYGLPIAAFALLVGVAPLRGWHRAPRRAAVEGLGWYGTMSLLALGVTIVLEIVYVAFDPGALALLDRPNPALEAAVGNPWFFVGFSFAVGAFEETIFRGWVYGFWDGRSARWTTPAVLTSVLFAGVHIYYGTTYGAAAPLIFPSLFLLGFAFAATYHATGGNLVVVALLHGATDAAAYLTLVSLGAGLALHYGLVLVGALVALVYYVYRTSPSRAPRGPPPVP